MVAIAVALVLIIVVEQKKRQKRLKVVECNSIRDVDARGNKVIKAEVAEAAGDGSG